MEHDPRFVLDASVVLAYLQREPGFERARDALRVPVLTADLAWTQVDLGIAITAIR